MANVKKKAAKKGGRKGAKKGQKKGGRKAAKKSAVKSVQPKSLGGAVAKKVADAIFSSVKDHKTASKVKKTAGAALKKVKGTKDPHSAKSIVHDTGAKLAGKAKKAKKGAKKSAKKAKKK